MHSLIFYRVAEANPEMSLDELYDSRSSLIQEFDVYFGSRSETVRYGVIDGAVTSLFGYGYCILLALAFHEKTGREFVMWTDGENTGSRWSGHVGVRVDDDHILDVFGITHHNEVASRYPSAKLGTPEVLTREEMLSRLADEKYRNDPWSFVDELERLLTFDYAERLVADHL